MNLRRLFLLAILVVIVSGCGSVATVRPLVVGEQALAFSLGGPVATVPGFADLPVPYTVARYRWGVAERLEARVGVHPTMLAFGTLGLEAGLSWLAFDQHKALPALCVGATPTMWVNPFNGAVGLAPEAEAALSWMVGESVMLYTGAQAMFQLEEPYVPWAALAGVEFRVSRHVGMGLELKWYAPTEAAYPHVVDFPVSIGNQGAIGGVIGLTLYPGGEDE